MDYICTICSKEKDRAEGLLPAAQRYVSERIDFVSQESQRLGKPFLIFSGRYGLLDAEARIPWYDQRLEPEGVAGIAPILVGQLRDKGVSTIIFYCRPATAPGWKPYYAALEEACRQTGVSLIYRPVDLG